MRQKRASYNKSINEAIESNAYNKQLTLAGILEYIPVYHVELVCDRQLKAEQRRSVHNSEDVVAILKEDLLKADRERLVSLMLNSKNFVIGIDIISVGSLASSVGAPREVYKAAIINSSASIILCHNHPSGDPTPSRDDILFTERISKSYRKLSRRLAAWIGKRNGSLFRLSLHDLPIAVPFSGWYGYRFAEEFQKEDRPQGLLHAFLSAAFHCAFPSAPCIAVPATEDPGIDKQGSLAICNAADAHLPRPSPPES